MLRWRAGDSPVFPQPVLTGMFKHPYAFDPSYGYSLPELLALRAKGVQCERFLWDGCAHQGWAWRKMAPLYLPRKE